MLDRQLEDFASAERLGLLLLGLLGIGERVTRLAALPRPDGGRAAPCALADALLGVIAAHRTLQAALGADPPPNAGRGGETSFSDPALLR